MANPSKFTREADEEISRHLNNESFRIATLIAGMYVNTRLSTLVRRSLEIDNKTGRKSFRRLFDDLNTGTLLNLCHRARMITTSEQEKIRRFLQLRNGIAHDFEMWDKLDAQTIKAIKHWCKFIIDFMVTTDHRFDPVRENPPEQKPSYLQYSRNE